MQESNIDKEYNRIKKEEGKEIHDIPLSLSVILREVKEGSWVIPEFQRDFVWGIDKFSLLFDSIYRGYTVGNILLWKTKEKLAHRKLGENKTISVEDMKNEDYTYILDGQQRLTTLFAVLADKELYRSGRKKAKKYKIFFDIKKDEFLNESQKLKEFKEKSIKDLLKEESFDKFRFIDLSQILDDKKRFPENLVKEEDDLLREKLRKKIITSEEYTKLRDELDIKKEPLIKFSEIIKSYKIHQIVERNEDLDKVVTVFERINTQNVKLDIYDIMVAKTYENVSYKNKLYTFNLGRAIKKITYKNELKKEELSPDYKLLEDENLYYNLDSVTALRLISIFSHSKNKIGLQKKDIYTLKAQQIQDNLPSIRQMFEQVARYLKNQINLPTIDVNYTDNKILSFLAYIFSKEKYSKIDAEMLNKWLWNTVIFNRYPGAQLQRIEGDLKEYEKGEKVFLQQIKNDRNLNIFNKDYSLDNNLFINAGYDNQKNLYLSLILLLNSLKPKDFNGKDEINLADYIGTNTKNNKHHIIPYNSKAAKGLREKHGEKLANFMLNNIANISIISSELNKILSGKNPEEYLKEYETSKDFGEILKRHLIDEEMYNCLKQKRYEDFLIKRTQKIKELIEKRCSVHNEELELKQEGEENGEENGEE